MVFLFSTLLKGQNGRQGRSSSFSGRLLRVAGNAVAGLTHNVDPVFTPPFAGQATRRFGTCQHQKPCSSAFRPQECHRENIRQHPLPPTTSKRKINTHGRQLINLPSSTFHLALPSGSNPKSCVNHDLSETSPSPDGSLMSSPPE